MANKAVSIPVTDEATEAGCTQSYIVKYRGLGTEIWTTMSPNPLRQPIVIENLIAGGAYEVEITRVCCNGQQSSPVSIAITVPA